jgi:hypothetical protein
MVTTYPADVLILTNSSTWTKCLRAFNDNATATLPCTFLWNEHTLCICLLIQSIHWELYQGVSHHSSVLLQDKIHLTVMLCSLCIKWNIWQQVLKMCKTKYVKHLIKLHTCLKWYSIRLNWIKYTQKFILIFKFKNVMNWFHKNLHEIIIW